MLDRFIGAKSYRKYKKSTESSIGINIIPETHGKKRKHFTEHLTTATDNIDRHDKCAGHCPPQECGRFVMTRAVR